MNNQNKKGSGSKLNESFDTNFTEIQSLNNSFISCEKKNKNKKVSFNRTISIVKIESYKKENKRNSISNLTIRENLIKMNKKNSVYIPKKQNCLGCIIY